MTIEIRKVRREDLGRIKEIYFKAGADEIKTQYPRESQEEITKKLNLWSKEIFENFEAEIESEDFYWIVAEINKKIIGFAISKKNNNSYGWLERNYIEKEYRGKGIGKEFVNKRMEWLKRNKVKNIYTKIFLNNKISKNNLKNFGFKPIEIIMEAKLK